MTPVSLHGTWKMVRAELSGEPAHPLVVDNTTLEITATHYSVRFGPEIADRGHLVASDPAASDAPPILTLRGLEGPNTGRVISAIYQAKGDLLRICYGLDGTTPDAFVTRADTPRYLVVYRRKSASG
jgi:uncharacterized protein (TIGR03067 family)